MTTFTTFSNVLAYI